MYAIRRIKDGFRAHKSESDKATVDQLISQAEHNYGVIQRQVMQIQFIKTVSVALLHTQGSGDFVWEIDRFSCCR